MGRACLHLPGSLPYWQVSVVWQLSVSYLSEHLLLTHHNIGPVSVSMTFYKVLSKPLPVNLSRLDLLSFPVSPYEIHSVPLLVSDLNMICLWVPIALFLILCELPPSALSIDFAWISLSLYDKNSHSPAPSLALAFWVLTHAASM
jgi:hypothetical protein